MFLNFFPTGKLTTNVNCRRLVPASTWHILKNYFPEAPEFDDTSVVCQACQVNNIAYSRETDKSLMPCESFV